jgi:hypothetical protein
MLYLDQAVLSHLRSVQDVWAISCILSIFIGLTLVLSIELIDHYFFALWRLSLNAAAGTVSAFLLQLK